MQDIRTYVSHETYLRLLLEGLEQADALVRLVVPESVVKLSRRQVVRVPGDFVDPDLRARRSDLIFEAWTIDGTSVLILIEHKSSVDRDAALQLLGYQTRALERDRRDGRRPRLVISVVFYHGDPIWTAELSPLGLVDGAGGFGPDARRLYPEMGYLLFDLARLLVAQYPEDPVTRTGLLALRAALAPTMSDDEVTGLLEAFALVPRDHLMKASTLTYIERAPSISWDRLMGLMSGQDRQWAEETMGSIVEAAVQVAAQENRREGRQEGLAEALLRLLERRFGEVPEDVAAQVLAAGVEDIESWFDAAVDAKSLDAVFLNGVAH